MIGGMKVVVYLKHYFFLYESRKLVSLGDLYHEITQVK